MRKAVNYQTTKMNLNIYFIEISAILFFNWEMNIP